MRATPDGVTVIVPLFVQPSAPVVTPPSIFCFPPAYGTVKLYGPAVVSAAPG